MGAYTLADEIAAMPTTELLAPLGRVLFPLFVDAAGDPQRLRRAFCKALGLQSLFALPAGIGLYMVSGDVVRLLLGERWLSAIPLMETLALISVVNALTHSGSYLLLALGKVSLQALLAWIQLALLAILAILVFPDTGVQGIAFIRLATSVLGLMVFVVLILRYVRVLNFMDFVVGVWRPMVATGMMALALSQIPHIDGVPLLIRLLFSVGAGAAVYGLVILLVWRSSACEDGAESYLLEQIGMKDRIVGWMGITK